MKRSVVTHHKTAWWRSHRATSRWTAGKGLLRGSRRGGKRVARTTTMWLAAPLPPLQPDQKAVGQHHRDRVPMKPQPQAALVLIPAHFLFGLLVALFHRIPAMGIAGQLFQHRGGRQITPVGFPLLRLASRGPFAYQPAHVPLAIAGDAPALHGHE